MNPYYPLLFTPYRIRNVEYRNRILMAPFLPQNADEAGLPSEYGMAYYERRARGGAAELTVGETPVDLDRACRRHGGYLDLTKDDYTIRESCMMSELTLMMRQHRTVSSIELCHVGQWNSPEYIRGGGNPVGPSAFTRPDGVQVEALTESGMEEIAEHFAHAAVNAQKFGFDAVLIHCGHGWLLSQFLSPLTNTRTDGYGGSLENRMRFPLLVLRRVREAVGPDMVIECRVSAEERKPGGIPLEETIAFLKRAEEYIDLVHVSVGCYQDPVATRTFPSVYEPYGCNAELSAAIKREVSIPVAVVGVINTPEVAEQILEEGKADFVAVCKQLIADPDFPRKAASGRASDIVPCIRCYRCMGQPGRPMNVICSVNPMAAREFRAGNMPRPRERQRVLVAGGGPAGMEAALTAAEQGHEVTLAEASGRLGGNLRFSECDPHKQDLRRYRDYLIRQVERCSGIRLLLNTRADAALVRGLAPDLVIAALGAEPVIPDIPGVEDRRWLSAEEAYLDPDRVGKRVLIVGGGLVGCELAVHLRELGRSATVLEAGPEPAPDCGGFPRMALLKQLEDGIRVRTGIRADRIESGGVRAGSEFLAADTVVLAVGMASRSREAEDLCSAAPRSVRIGDCVRPGKVADAVGQGYFAGMDA